MNMHVPRSIITVEELKQIASVPTQIISPGRSKPVIAIVQDSLIGAYLLTKDGVKMSRNVAYNLLINNNDYDGKMEVKDYYSGKEIMSSIIPNVTYKNLDDWGNECIIKKGIVEEGMVAGNALGKSSRGLIQQINNIYGFEECSKFLNKVQSLVTRWMTYNSFSISFGDCLPAFNIKDDIPIIMTKGIEKTKDILRKVYDGVYNPDLDRKYLLDAIESDIRGSLKSIGDELQKIIIDNIDEMNGNMVAIKSGGTKAKKDHMKQMCGSLGIADVWGRMIDFGYTDRTLPYFHKFDMGPDSRGFCRSSIIKGLTPSETFFHAMSARTGTIDTAVKSVTGDTPIIIQENGIMKHINIGDWIDELLELNSKDVKNYEEKEMELLQLKHEVYIPTTDFDGNVSWGIIKNITRHDPGKELYEIKTSGGRNVIVTESHSLLIWNGTQFERRNSSLAKIGDFVPVSQSIQKLDNQVLYTFDEINKNYLVKGKYLFMNNVERDLINYQLNVYGYQTLLGDKWIKIVNDFKQVNDTVLDEIVEINKVDISLYPKVYDLTVPSTLNFGLANGLHVVDTADSGYISRKFIKATEDLKVYYDGTVRNASGFIVQPLYGDDCFDPVKLEKTKIELLEFNNDTMIEKFKFENMDNYQYWSGFMEDDSVDTFFENDDLENRLNKEYQLMMEFRRQLREDVFKNINYINDSNTFIPINLHRLIQNTIDNFNIKKYHLSDLSPLYVLDRLDYLINTITQYLPEKNDSMLLFKIIFKTHLSPKRCIFEHRLNKLAFDYIIDKVIHKITDSFCTPGEMVGVLASQTLGEISTQLTMNSVSWNTKLLIKYTNKTFVKDIGDFIDNLLTEQNEQVVIIDNNTNTEYLDTQKMNFEIQCVDENGLMHWKNIEGITRHDPGGKVVKIKTRSGREVVATQSKSFLVRQENKIIPMEGSKIKIGDYLPIQFQKPINENNDLILPENINNNIDLQYELDIRNGLTIERNIIPSVKLSNGIIKDYKLCDLEKIYKETNNEEDKEIIENIFKEQCYYDKIESIEYIDLLEETPECNKVYDLTVQDTKNFNILGGLCMRDTFHLAGGGGIVTTQGVPRLNEITKVSNAMKSKNMNIYLNDEIKNNKEKIMNIKNKFEYKKLVDLVYKTEIIYEDTNEKGMIEEDIAFMSVYNEFNKLFGMDEYEECIDNPWVLRITFDKELLLNSNIKMSEIQETIISKSNNDDGNIQCPFSDDNASDLILRIKIRNNSETNFMEYMSEYEKQLLDLRLRGIDGITKIELTDNKYVNYDNDGNVIEDKEIMLQTEGSNLLDILCQDFVDNTRTTTNDIVEICDVFGIEAVRQKIFDELTTVYKGEEPNPRHIELIADVMTYRGRLMQIDRHGINRNGETGVISKASFEESVNMFVKAAVFAETDKMKGVSANILAGQLCNCGTNNFQVLIDEDKIMKYSVDDEDIIIKKDLSYQEVSNIIEKDFEKEDDITHADFEFGFGLESTQQFNIGKSSVMDGVKINTSKSNLLNVNNNNNQEENKEEEIDITQIPIDEENDETSEIKNITFNNQEEDSNNDSNNKSKSKKKNNNNQQQNITINIEKLNDDENSDDESDDDEELLVKFNKPPVIKKIVAPPKKSKKEVKSKKETKTKKNSKK